MGIYLLLLSAALALSACGGGGTANRAPTASAGADQTVAELTVVNLNGSGSDPDAADTLTFAWLQTAGQSVTINNANMAQASFTAPDVAAGVPEDLIFRLAVSDGNGGSASDTVTITVEDPNNPPTSSAGADQTVDELTVVQLIGSGSDADAGDTLSFAWTQTGGQAVTINNANMAQADFVAPDVVLGIPEVLTFQLEVSDGAGGVATDSVAITVQEPQVIVTISGEVQYEFVPPAANCNGLDFGAKVPRPIRQATVQLINAGSGAVMDTTISNDSGNYSFSLLANTDVFLRVRAELKRTAGNPSWDVEVRDNTANTSSPLLQRPLYVLENSTFNSGTADSISDLMAATGWGGTSYTGVRAAAPFSVLDMIYSVMSVILSEDPPANFPALDVFWSVNNSTAEGTGTFDEIVASGEIGTSFYSANRLFLLGKENDDTEEFDDHVVVHEWGHYFEDNFSRSDSIGGPHGLGQALDMRLAFGEGFATALSGIGLNNPTYCDTFGAAQGNGFGFDIEIDRFGVEGWFNELSIINLIYDLWDTDIDGADTGSLGFGPIYDVMTGPQAATPAFTSIFSFATELKAQNPGQAAFVDAILGDHNITAAGIDIYGSTETNDGDRPSNPTPEDVLPIYTDVLIGTPFKICSNSQFDNGRDGNKLSEYRYLILDVNPPSALTFTVENDTPSTPTVGFNCSADANDPENHEHSDPDIAIFQNGNFVWAGFSCEPNSEVTRSPVLSGRYVLDVVEFRYLDDESPVGFPEQTCFDITITP